MRAQAVINSEDANGNQASGHQNVTQKKDDRDARHGRTEESKADPIQQRGPVLAGRKRRHDIRFRFAHQLVYGDELKSAGAGAIDDQRERQHGSFAVTAASVQENNVAALLIARLARWQVVEHASGDLSRRERGLVIPVPGVDLVADGDVAQALRDFERPHFVFSIRFRIDRVRRTEQHGSNAQAAGEQLLGEVQLHLHVAGTNRADIRMGKRMVPDFMAFPVNALRQTAELLRLDSDQKECSGDMLAFKDIENLRGPLRIGTVVEGHGELVLAEAIARHTVRLGQTLEFFPVDEPGLLVYGQHALAVGGPRLDVQDLAVTLHVDILTRRD